MADNTAPEPIPYMPTSAAELSPPRYEHEGGTLPDSSTNAQPYQLPSIPHESPALDPFPPSTQSFDPPTVPQKDHYDTEPEKFVSSQERSSYNPIAPMPGATADTPNVTTTSTQHKAGEGYSSHNKIPTVAGYREDRKRLEEEERQFEEEERKRKMEEERRQKQSEGEEQARDAEEQEGEGQPDEEEDHHESSKKGTIKSDRKKNPGSEEKDEMMNRMAPKKKEKPNQAGAERRGPRNVVDPVTGRRVIVQDADYHDEYDQSALDPSNPKDGPAETKPGGQGPEMSSKNVGPVPARPGNINLQTFPPPVESESLKNITLAIEQITIAGAVGLVIVWWFVAFGSGYARFFWRTGLLAAFGVVLWMAAGVAARNVEHELERVRMQMHKQRADQFSPPTPESVEWINSFLEICWKLVSPDMFVGTVDMVEDVMQASLPAVVNAVKISDYGQGTNPVRIVSMRALPDKPTDDDYPKEEWIDQGQKPEKSDEEKEARRNEDLAKSQEEKDMDQSGEYVNYEVSLAYNAKPGQTLRESNIHLLLQFFLGAYDLFSLPVPIWASVEGFAATARLRIQMVPEAPYIRNLTFTLMGVPKVDVHVTPMTRAFPNVLDLPIISGFVQSSIAAAAAEYVAPKSMTLNMAQMLSGGGIKKDTKALGVLAITIHHATGLSAQDSGGKSDPYLVLAYAKFGKPLYSSRIILGDLNPVWEETAFLLLSDDEVKAGENLAVMLWDSDKRTSDDLIGRVQVPVVELMLKPNQVHDRNDDLMGFEDADDMKGKLSWSVAFYDKAPFNERLNRQVNHELPAEIRNRPELQDKSSSKADTKSESDALNIPPDPSYPAGILSIIVHQINNLENRNLKGTSGGNREGHTGQDTKEADEKTDKIPSAYCEIVVNDDLIYKTRTKQYTTMPYYEAGTECFVRDWRSTVVRVVTRDDRVREHDPIMGVVTLPLAKILANSSQVTKLYAMQDGVGFGRVNISVLFRSVEAKLPRNYLGWDTGTLEILSNIRFEPEQGAADHDISAKTLKVSVSTSDAQHKIKAKAAHKEGEAINWHLDELVRLPVYDRYSSALVFELDPGTKILGMGGDPDAVASLWFQDLVDDEETEVRIPVVAGKDIDVLRQNVLNENCKKTHEYDIVGHLICTVKLDSGLDEDHYAFADTQQKRHEMEQYHNAEGMAEIAKQNAHANDDGVIDKKEQKKIDEAHKQELRSRHRGIYQSGVVRSTKWSKDGLKDRMSRMKNKMTGNTKTEKSVETEA